MNKERTRGWLGQPSIIKSLEQKYGERAMKERLSLAPRTPRFIAGRLENPEDKVNPADHKTYRSGVGTLFYLTNTQQTGHLQSSQRAVHDYGCTSAGAHKKKCIR